MQSLVQQLGKGLLGYHCISGDPTGMLWEKKYQVCCQSSKLYVCPVQDMPYAYAHKARVVTHQPRAVVACLAAVLRLFDT